MVEKLMKNLIPIAIIVAGIIIAGAIIYINQDKKTTPPPEEPKPAEQFSDCLNSGKFASEVNGDLQEGQEAGVSGTPTFFINGEILVGAQPFSEFQSVIEDKLKGETQNIAISIENEPILGRPEALVTLIEFSDFQCPFCGRYALQTFPQIKKEYVDTGKVKVVFKNFPLPFHENAQKAAEAGECAFEQGKFWEYKEKLFENQQTLSLDNLKKYAQDLGLD